MSSPGASVSCRSARPSGLTDQMSPWVRSVDTKAPNARRPSWPSYVAPAGDMVLMASSVVAARTVLDRMGVLPLEWGDDARRAGAARLCPVGRSPVASRSQGGRVTRRSA